MSIVCDYCGKPAELVTGRDINSDAPAIAMLNFWKCGRCDAYVGCYEGGTKPLGRLANAELRQAKNHAHAAFDPIWRRGAMTRAAAYQWLANELGIDPDNCHIGMMDEAACQRVVEVCQQAPPTPITEAVPGCPPSS